MITVVGGWELGVIKLIEREICFWVSDDIISSHKYHGIFKIFDCHISLT